MFNPPTSPDTGNAISSPALAGGLSQPDLLGGPTIQNCGREARPASRSRSLAREKARMTIGTCGPTFLGSSVPAGPLHSWENRLRQRLARHGSTECWMTWKASATPAGRPLSRLVPSTPRTGATACGFWPTPTTRDHKDSLGMSFAPRKDGASRLDLLPRQVFWIARQALLWPTPTAADARRGYRPPRAHDTGVPLNQAVAMTSGIPPYGSTDTTPKGVGLNPAFPCWLMEFPAAWDACAPTAMPSSRKSRPK